MMNKLVILMLATAVFTQLADIPEPELQTRTYDYEVSLEHLCPNAPSEEAAQCMSSYNLSQSVEDTLIQTVQDYPDKLKYGKILQVTACSIQKVPTLLFNLHIFCYFKGVKESLLNEFSTVDSLEDFDALKDELGKLIQNETRLEFKQFYETIFDELTLKRSQIVALEEMQNDKKLIQTEEFGYKITPEAYEAMLAQGGN